MKKKTSLVDATSSWAEDLQQLFDLDASPRVADTCIMITGGRGWNTLRFVMWGCPQLRNLSSAFVHDWGGLEGWPLFQNAGPKHPNIRHPHLVSAWASIIFLPLPFFFQSLVTLRSRWIPLTSFLFFCPYKMPPCSGLPSIWKRELWVCFLAGLPSMGWGIWHLCS